jgi:hypothetical protein
MRRAYPRMHWRYHAVRRAAAKFAIHIGRANRGRGCPVMWLPNETLARLIGVGRNVGRADESENS